MNLFNPYLIAHKGLRNILSNFLISIGSTDYNDQNALKKLKSLGDDLFMLLDSHSHLEESILLKELSNKINADELNDFNQHREISLLENRLKEKFYSLTIESSELEIHTFYLEFSSFYSQYLKHLYEEETETLALLQNKFTEEELINIHLKILDQISPEHQLVWNTYILPAVNPTEKNYILEDFQSRYGNEFYLKLESKLKNS